jgi:hypothetical protein
MFSFGVVCFAFRETKKMSTTDAQTTADIRKRLVSCFCVSRLHWLCFSVLFYTFTSTHTQPHVHSPTHTAPHTQLHIHSPTYTAPHTQPHTHSPTHTAPHTHYHRTQTFTFDHFNRFTGVISGVSPSTPPVC